jgi:hypothetical protein
MKNLGYSTAVLSWQLFKTVTEILKSSKFEKNIDMNTNALSCCILSTATLEAFTNEIISITHAFNNGVNSEGFYKLDKIGIENIVLESVEQLNNKKYKNFYERYKQLIKELRIPDPIFLSALSHLKKIRDEITHYQTCDMSLIEKNDCIKFYQEPPEVIKHLRSFKVNKWSVVASDASEETSWILRISTNAFAFWSATLVLEAITYLLENIPIGLYRESVLRYYQANKEIDVFNKSKSEISTLQDMLFPK